MSGASENIRHKRLIIIIEIELGSFASHFERFFEIGLKTIGNTFIISAENHFVIAFEIEYQLVILVTNLGSLVKRSFDSFIYGLSLGRNDGWF